MEIIPVLTRRVLPPKDNILDIFEEALPPLEDGDILIIASKIVAIHQGRCIRASEVDNELTLIEKEADKIICSISFQGKVLPLSIKLNTLTPSSGIDRSNANGCYVLWPEAPEKFAKQLHALLTTKFHIENLGIIVTDSSPLPMRKGTVGISIGFYGIVPYNSYLGKKDIFDRPLEMTRSNVVDALAAVGVLGMGEGNEQTPIVIIRKARFVSFTKEENYEDLFIEKNKDIYGPLLRKNTVE